MVGSPDLTIVNPRQQLPSIPGTLYCNILLKPSNEPPALRSLPCHHRCCSQPDTPNLHSFRSEKFTAACCSSVSRTTTHTSVAPTFSLPRAHSRASCRALVFPPQCGDTTSTSQQFIPWSSVHPGHRILCCPMMPLSPCLTDHTTSSFRL